MPSFTVKTPWKVEGAEGKFQEFDVTVPEGKTMDDAIAYVHATKNPEVLQENYRRKIVSRQIQEMNAQNARRFTGQPGPTDEPNPFLAGMGGTMKGPYNWGKQVLGIDPEGVAEDKRMLQQLREESPQAQLGAFAGDVAMYSRLPFKNTRRGGLATGTVIGGTQPVDVEPGESPYLAMTGNAVVGAIFGYGVAGATQWVGGKLRQRKGGMEGAQAAFEKEILGAKATTDREAGEMAKIYMKELGQMNSKEINLLYKDAMQAYGLNKIDIPIRPFIEILKRQQGNLVGAEWSTTQRLVRGIERMVAKNAKRLGEKYDGQSIGIVQLNSIMKSLNKQFRATKGPDKIAEHGQVKYIQSILGRTMEGEKAKALLAVGQRAYSMKAQGTMIEVAGKEMTLSKFINRARPADIHRQVADKGTLGNLERTKEIFLEGYKSLTFTTFGPLHARSVRQKGVVAWNDLRARTFADWVRKSHEIQGGKSVMVPDKFRKQFEAYQASNKMDVMFSPVEQKVMQTLGEVEERGTLEMAKSVFGGPRLSVSARFFREVIKRALNFLGASKETAGFSVEVGTLLGKHKKHPVRKVAEYVGQRLPLKEIGTIIGAR